LEWNNQEATTLNDVTTAHITSENAEDKPVRRGEPVLGVLG
jgi:hypothetical protein